MYKVSISEEFLRKIFGEGNTLPPATVLEGMKDGDKLVAAQVTFDNGYPNLELVFDNNVRMAYVENKVFVFKDKKE